MIISPGQWLGKGKLLVAGASLGEAIEVDLQVEDDGAGITLSGRLGGKDGGDISIRLGPDDVGTYMIDARLLGLSLDGIAKLESEPNLAMLWNEASTQHATVALFAISGGVGCRGFWREGERSKTWEILFKLKQHVVGGSNVVSLRRRRS